jgi:hypothetical protein
MVRLPKSLVAELLSPAALALAEREIRRLASERQAVSAAKPGRNTGKISKLDQQISQLERFRSEGVLSPDVAGAAIAKASADRQELTAAETAGDTRLLDRVVQMLPRAAEAYWAQVARVREVLSDEKAVHTARVALRELLGGPVKLRPASDGNYLIAEADTAQPPC